MTTLTLLGATGSIGTQALEVLAAHPGRFRVAALGAGGSDLATLARQVTEHDVPLVGLARNEEAALRDALDAHARQRGQTAPTPEIITGPDAMVELAGGGSDIVLNAVTGSVGLAPTLAALRAGSRLALANKESLVAGGKLVMAAASRPDQIVPVDSEHSAMAQALRAGRRDEVSRLILTASGGPFRGKSRGDLLAVTRREALDHPTWSMGPVITINSATLVN
ncbi:MAG TPA: 1-deoxy-D-xylulose-5-phosphate reductoisomerase, partial [Actinomycetaceae bacterium]|nr:1-deoxy-D-xylulose-5-phosphate reductoisomerase [Actinomycetaceae bacterium]